MRTVIACLLCLSLAGSLYAGGMLKRGTIDLGGEASFHHYTGSLFEGYSQDSRTNYSARPDLGYFVIDGFSVGALLEYDRDEYGDFENTGLGGGLRAAYYFLPEKTSSPYFSAAYIFTERKNYIEDYYYLRSAETELMVSAGYLLGINSHVALTAAVGYTSDKWRYSFHHYYYGHPDPDPETWGQIWSVLLGFKIFHFE